MLSLSLALLVAAPLALAPESRLWIEGDSSMHAWSCKAEKFGVTGEAQPAKLGELPAVRTLRVTVPVASLNCKNDTMNDKLREALKADKHPRVEFVLASLQPQPGAPSAQHKLQAIGELTIAGRALSAPIDLVAVVQPDGTVAVHGNLPLLMTDFGVDPPSAMLGLMKTKDAVTVKFELHIRTAQLVN